MIDRVKKYCDHCGEKVDITLWFQIGTHPDNLRELELCEGCLRDALGDVPNAMPECVKTLLRQPGWEVQTVQGVRNVLVDTRIRGYAPDCYIRVGRFTVPVYEGKVPRQ
jgi:hypothetical protein